LLNKKTKNNMLYRKLNLTSPLVAFTEPPIASITGSTNPFGLTPEQIEAIATYNKTNTGNTGSKAVGVLDSIFGGLSSVIDSTTNLIGGWFNRGTQVVDTNQKNGVSTVVLLIGAVLIVVLIVFLMKKK
jgi:hypothetical protein